MAVLMVSPTAQPWGQAAGSPWVCYSCCLQRWPEQGEKWARDSFYIGK